MTEHALRDLAAAGATSVVAPPFLAERVLALRARSVRRRRLGASLALAGLVAGGALAARSGGETRFYEVYQPTGAMAPTVGVGEHLVADRTLLPQREDVVELSFANGGTFLAVKRVIGLPGDVIACPASTDGYCHAWTRNGRPLSEPWIGRDRLYPPNDPAPLPGFFVDGGSRIVPFPAVTVTSDHVFLLGDNRDNAVDSRISKPVLQKLSAVKAVGVQVIGTDGHRRPIPGASPHDVPGPGGTIDPPAAPPTSNSNPVTTPTG